MDVHFILYNNVDLLDCKCNKNSLKNLSMSVLPIIILIFFEGVESSVRDKAFNFDLPYPVAPKVKETHYKIIFRIYPVDEFLRKKV